MRGDISSLGAGITPNTRPNTTATMTRSSARREKNPTMLALSKSLRRRWRMMSRGA